MRKVFADSGYWIALIFPDDQLHHRARAVANELRGVQLLTTQMVLVEVLNHASRKRSADRLAASDLIAGLEADPNIEIIPQTPQQFADAADRYAARPDRSWSVTDCASFLVMQTLGIDQALAYDRDFEQAGFVALLRD